MTEEAEGKKCLTILINAIRHASPMGRHDGIGNVIIGLDLYLASALAACNEIERLQAANATAPETEEKGREPKFEIDDVLTAYDEFKRPAATCPDEFDWSQAAGNEHAEANETKRKPKFKIGEVVWHKGCGRKAVVLGIYTRCINPDHITGFHCMSNPDKCAREFTGGYKLATGFGEKHDCDEEEIEDERTEQRVQNENAS